MFLDESGMLMAPLVRRSWSVRGQTPVLRQRGRCHQKVSAIAAPPTPRNADQTCYAPFFDTPSFLCVSTSLKNSRTRVKD